MASSGATDIFIGNFGYFPSQSTPRPTLHACTDRIAKRRSEQAKQQTKDEAAGNEQRRNWPARNFGRDVIHKRGEYATKSY